MKTVNKGGMWFLIKDNKVLGVSLNLGQITAHKKRLERGIK